MTIRLLKLMILLQIAFVIPSFINAQGKVENPSTKGYKIFDLFDKEKSTTTLYKEEDQDAKIKKNAFIKVIPDKTTCYEGEPLLLTYKLYTTLKSNSSILTYPTFGVSKSYIVSGSDPVTNEEIDGITFKVFTLLKIQILSYSAGTLQMTPLVLSDTIQFTKAEDDNILTLIKNIESRNASVQVICPHKKNSTSAAPLWTGLLQMTVSTSRDSIPKGENGYLRIELSGNGDIDSLRLPVINWSKNVSVYDASDSLSVDKKVYPLKGKRVYQIPFTIDSGSYTDIPAIQYTYFNTTTKDLETLQSKQIRIIASKPNISTEKKDDKNDLFSFQSLIILTCGFLLLLIGIVSIKKFKAIRQKKLEEAREQTERNERIKQEQQLLTEKRKDFWKKVQDLEVIADDRAFYSEVNDLLNEVLKEKFDTTDISLLKLQAELYNDIVKLSETVNTHLYSPFIIEEDKALVYKLAIQTFKKLMS